MLAPHCNPWQNVSPGLIAIAVVGRKGCLLDESAQRQQRWARLAGNEQLQEQKMELPRLGANDSEGDSSTSSQTIPVKPLWLRAHTVSENLSDGFEKVQHRNTNFFPCTECKVMQLSPNEKRQRCKPKYAIIAGGPRSARRFCCCHEAAPP